MNQIEYVIWGTEQGAPKWRERILMDQIHVLAIAKDCLVGFRARGFQNVRIQKIDLSSPDSAPDFVGALNI